MTGPVALVENPLAIGIVVRALPVQRLGGLEYHARDLTVALARRNHSIHILSTPGAKEESWPDTSGRITVSEIDSAANSNYSIGFFFKLKSALTSFIKQHDLDLVIVIDLAGLFLNPGDFTVPIVGLIHGTITSEVPLDWRYWQNLGFIDKCAALWRYKTRIMLKPVFRSMIDRMDHIMVDSEFTKFELLFSIQDRLRFQNVNRLVNEHRNRLELNQRVTVVPLGIDEQRYPTSMTGSGPYVPGKTLKISLLGRLQQIKGIAQAIYAAHALVARGVDFEMNIGGSGSFADEARRLILRLDLQERVNLVGRVEPANVGAFLASHDVFLFPDLTQPAFGLVAVEAMHYGLPVVAAHVGAVSEVVTDETGWLYDPWNVHELAGILTFIADNRDLLARKAASAKMRAMEFTAAKMAVRTEERLIEIVGKSNPRQV